VQLGVYTRLLATHHVTHPEKARLVLGDNSVKNIVVNDFASYVQHAMVRLKTFAASPPAESYPERPLTGSCFRRN
jgi:hypothetical protein